MLDRIERGEADWGFAPAPRYFDQGRRLAAKYGVNKARFSNTPRFFVKAGLTRQAFVFNTLRPLFRNNPGLRRAVNFAVDRAAFVRAGGGSLAARPSDQYLPPSLPGFRDANIYPLRGPDLRRARTEARGNQRGRKAVLYTFDQPAPLAMAQGVKRDLARIGVAVTIQPIAPAGYFARLARRAEPWDIALNPWSADYLDPYSYINLSLEGRFAGLGNMGWFRSRLYDRLMAGAARLGGKARYRAYGELDIKLARDAAPLVTLAFANTPTLVSRRVGCIVLRPGLDLAAACLRP